MLLPAQNPEGFNYQAVVRDGSGNPVANTNVQVRISILSDTTGFYAGGTGTYIWEEEQTRKTNPAGLISMVIGNPAATKIQGSASSFTGIDWIQSPLFIGMKLLRPGSSWKNMGTSRLWSVPYSMVARGIAEGSKITIVSENDASEDALFEVKRKDGQTVFAVYNDAVNVYVPDQQAKKAKGGFSVGGYDQSKGFSRQYMTVTPDSIRFYIDNNPGKGAKGGFAVGGYDLTKGNDKKYLSLYGASTVDTIKNASQVLWYPRKEAFLAGKIEILHPDSVGLNSFSMGYKNQAKGNYSHAMGYQAVARGDYSTAIGRGAISGPNSFALGNFSKALGNDSYAIGSASIASGITSIAIGVGSKAPGFASVSLGFRSEATDSNSVAIGYYSKALSPTAHAFGLRAEASAKGAIALGMYSTATARYATSLGYYSSATDIFSTAIGYYAQAIGPDSYAIGSHAKAEGAKSFAIGSYGLLATGNVDESRTTKTTGYCALAFGMGAQASKVGAMSMGVNTTAAGDQSLAMGYEAAANGAKSIAIGAHYNVTYNRPVWEYSTILSKWVINYVPTLIDKMTVADGDYSIAIGNGNHASNNALSLGTNNEATAYGSVAIGHSNQVLKDFSFAAGFNNYLTGQGSFALGNNLLAKSANSFVIGAFNLEEGTVNEWLPKDPLFVIGNGNPTLRSNAFVVLKDGNIVLSPNIIPAVGGEYQLVMGSADNVIKKVTSSARYKTEITPLTDICWLYDLNPVSFQYSQDASGRTQYGLIAEEMEFINKDLVIYSNGVPDGITYNSLFAPMIRALQDQKSLIEDLNEKNAELKGENTELRDRLTRLESTVAGIIENGR
jgi:hypothetical protein